MLSGSKIVPTCANFASVLADRGAMTKMSAHSLSQMCMTSSPIFDQDLQSSSSPAIMSFQLPHSLNDEAVFCRSSGIP